MKIKSIIILLLLSACYSCGSKMSVSKDVYQKETDAYIKKMDANKNLKVELTEGALTDEKGYNDIGTFKYYVTFDPTVDELIRIKNVEKTSGTITETYYFQKGDLIFVNSSADNSTLYIHKGKVISESNATEARKKMLLAKAERFENEIKKNH